MLSAQDAVEVAHCWRVAWNSHDPELVVARYHPEVEYWSPFVATLVRPEGRLVGRDELRRYVRAAYERRPDLWFPEPLHLTVGVRSLTMVYEAPHGSVAAETLTLDSDLAIRQAICHYGPTPS